MTASVPPMGELPRHLRSVFLVHRILARAQREELLGTLERLAKAMPAVALVLGAFVLGGCLWAAGALAAWVETGRAVGFLVALAGAAALGLFLRVACRRVRLALDGQLPLPRWVIRSGAVLALVRNGAGQFLAVVLLLLLTGRCYAGASDPAPVQAPGRPATVVASSPVSMAARGLLLVGGILGACGLVALEGRRRWSAACAATGVATALAGGPAVQVAAGVAWIGSLWIENPPGSRRCPKRRRRRPGAVAILHQALWREGAAGSIVRILGGLGGGVLLWLLLCRSRWPLAAATVLCCCWAAWVGLGWQHALRRWRARRRRLLASLPVEPRRWLLLDVTVPAALAVLAAAVLVPWALVVGMPAKHLPVVGGAVLAFLVAGFLLLRRYPGEGGLLGFLLLPLVTRLAGAMT